MIQNTIRNVDLTCCSVGISFTIDLTNNMISFFNELKKRNFQLYIFGSLCLLGAFACFILINITSVNILGINAWIKPLKFFLSICIYSWSMAWFCEYLRPALNIRRSNLIIIITLAFELLYISVQAGRGELSHYNISTTYHAVLYFLMALAASITAIWTGYIGLLFFNHDLPDLPRHYLWSIRFGLLIFTVFSFEGFLMGSQLSHTIGNADGSTGVPFFNWSLKFGDLRVSHFFGLHALQIIPLTSYYLFRNTRTTFVFTCLYILFTMFTLWQGLSGHPFLRI